MTSPMEYREIKAKALRDDRAIGAEKMAADVVAGTQLSGMSTTVVIPPAAAAWVAVEKPSHSVRPGSLR